jgi:hypothetical protein
LKNQTWNGATFASGGGSKNCRKIVAPKHEAQNKISSQPADLMPPVALNLLRKVLFKNAKKAATVKTGESVVYPAAGLHFADHQTVNSSQYE